MTILDYHLPTLRKQIFEHERRLLLLIALVLSTMLSLGLVFGAWCWWAIAPTAFSSGTCSSPGSPFGWLASFTTPIFAARDIAPGWRCSAFSGSSFSPTPPTSGPTWFTCASAQPGPAWWCDLVMALSFGWNGMLLGLLSLYLIQRVVLERLGRWWGWATVAAALALGSFGISLGRFDRFNSWDVFSKPLDLLVSIAEELRHPISHPLPFAIAGLFFAFLALAYLTLLASWGWKETK